MTWSLDRVIGSLDWIKWRSEGQKKSLDQKGPVLKKIRGTFNLLRCSYKNRGQQAYDASHAQTADPFNKHTTTETYGTVVFIF